MYYDHLYWPGAINYPACLSNYLTLANEANDKIRQLTKLELYKKNHIIQSTIHLIEEDFIKKMRDQAKLLFGKRLHEVECSHGRGILSFSFYNLKGIGPIYYVGLVKRKSMNLCDIVVCEPILMVQENEFTKKYKGCLRFGFKYYCMCMLEVSMLYKILDIAYHKGVNVYSTCSIEEHHKYNYFLKKFPNDFRKIIFSRKRTLPSDEVDFRSGPIYEAGIKRYFQNYVEFGDWLKLLDGRATYGDESFYKNGIL